MNKYLITYDLHKIRDYTRLYEILEKWRAVRMTESCWLAELKGPAHTVRDLIRSVLDEDDSIVVLTLIPGTEWATANASRSAANWLSNMIAQAA